MYIFTYLRYMMQFHPVVQVLTVLQQDLFVSLLDGEIAHFTAVFFHIKELFTIKTFVVQHIFVARGT